MEWKDATRYSIGERGKKEPTAWEINLSKLKIYITNKHTHYPDSWIMHCYEVDISCNVLGKNLTLDDDKQKALEIVRYKL